MNLTAEEKTREYYNSSDADIFYHEIWGGEDIHIGIYQEGDDITTASRRTIERMIAALKQPLPATARVLDIGSGYGGSARFLATRSGCRVDCLNLSAIQNKRNRLLCRRAGLSDRVRVKTGSFESIPFRENTFELVWCQDALLHAENKERVFAEVARVLRVGGCFIFTDPMQTAGAPQAALRPVLERIHLPSLGWPDLYRELGARAGLTLLQFQDLSDHLSWHYSCVLKELIRKKADLAGSVSREYLERMESGLGLWVEAGKSQYLQWGIFLFQRENA
ncbi:MAG: methyltransferase domain-containing protein [Spirochaetales bacterium]|nr:methyltransferase domain-containing protein [Spirochaetales bacterium]